MPVPEVELAKDVGLVLEPYLPELLGAKAAPSGDADFVKAQALWDKVSGYAPVMAAAQDLLTNRTHVEKQATLRWRIKIECEADGDLFAALQVLL